MENSNRIEIKLGNGFNLVAERDEDSSYDREVYVYLEREDGVYWQNLALVRPTYTYQKDSYDVKWNDEQFDVLVWTDEEDEDWTTNHVISLFHEENGKEN